MIGENGNGLLVPGKNPGGLGERSLWSVGTRDIRLVERALRESWTISDSARTAMIGRLELAVSDPKTRPRAFFSAVKALLAISRINLAAVDVASRAQAAEDLAERVAKLMAELKKREAQNRLQGRRR